MHPHTDLLSWAWRTPCSTAPHVHLSHPSSSSPVMPCPLSCHDSYLPVHLKQHIANILQNNQIITLRENSLVNAKTILLNYYFSWEVTNSSCEAHELSRYIISWSTCSCKRGRSPSKMLSIIWWSNHRGNSCHHSGPLDSWVMKLRALITRIRHFPGAA